MCGGGSKTIFLSAEEDLFFDLYLVSLSLSTPLVRFTHMCFHHACWKRLLYLGAWALYCCTLLLYVNTYRVSRNMFWQSLVRAFEVALVLVRLLPGKFRCCGCLFFLSLLFYFSASESSVTASVACWSVDGGVYWIHLCQHWLLGLFGRLVQWLDLDLLLRCIMAPGVGKEMLAHTCFQWCFQQAWIYDILQLLLQVIWFPRALCRLCKNGPQNLSNFFIGFIRFQVLIASWNFLILLIIV